MDENSYPFNISTVQTDNVYTNCWSNVWEWGHGDMAYKFANADYKVTETLRNSRQQFKDLYTQTKFIPVFNTKFGHILKFSIARIVMVITDRMGPGVCSSC